MVNDKFVNFILFGIASFLIIFSFGAINANAATYINVPDKNLLKMLNDNIRENPSRTSPVTKEQVSKIKRMTCEESPDITGIKKLTGLEYATSLEHLCLNDQKNIESKELEKIKNLKNLKFLYLGNNKITNIDALKNLTNLEELSLFENNITNISALKDMTKLKQLKIYTNNITNIEPLKNLKMLKHLTVRDNNISDISSLKGLTDLEYLIISGNNISDISVLSNLKKLKKLGMVRNKISNLTPIKNLTNLEYISASSNKIKDLSPISNLKKLDYLSLNFNQITDIRPIPSGISNLYYEGQEVHLPDVPVGKDTSIYIEPFSQIKLKFKDGNGTYSNGKLRWTSVSSFGKKTITFDNNKGFNGTIYQTVRPVGTIEISDFEVLGDRYFGDSKFFEGEQINFRFKINFNSEFADQTSGNVKVRITGSGINQEVLLNTNIKHGEKAGWFYGTSFTKAKARNISGNNFKELLETLELEVLPIKTGVLVGKESKKPFSYYSVNKVYDISIDEIVHHEEYPVPGEKTDVKLMICNNGNQDIGGYMTEIIYNGQKMTVKEFPKIERGSYEKSNKVNSNCIGVPIQTEVPEIYDPNAFVEFEAIITPSENLTEITTTNNRISATFEQGVGPEPIYVCDEIGELIDIVYNEKNIKNGSPDNCKEETGLIDPGPDVGEPITEVISEVPLDEEYFYEPIITKPVDAPVAKQVNGTDFKEEVENIFVQVNRDSKHPKDDINKSNDKKLQKFKSVNKVYDLSAVQVTAINPSVPKSNEGVKVTVKVCNEGNQNILDYKAKVSFKTQNRNSGEGDYKNISRGPYNNIDTIPNCKDIIVNTKMFDIEDPEESFLSRVLVQPMIPSGEAERSTINNITTFDTLVRNPNASVFVRNANDNKNVISETGGVSVVINNNMFRKISSPCGTDCLSTNNTSAHIKITDLLNEEVIEIPVTYNDLEHSKQKIVDISKPILNYIKGLENKDYEVIEFKIEARIPHYKHEVDYSGQPKYDDNVVVDTIHYFPPRPNVSIMKCTELGNPAGYFAMNGGEGPIKTCAGHYPNNPSTAIEKGMQAYHYVMHRFFPAPMPKYEIKTPAAGEKHSPHYFNQIYKLEEPVNEMGDEDTFLFANKDANGIWKERGRYLPTGATFKFEVKEKQVDGRIIAAGSIHYDIPNGCYQTETLDMKHQYGCDEIMFFVPNVDNKDNFVKEPKGYEGNVSYPLGGEDNATTKIPYLNPGLYEFKVEAEESFEYHYQVNNGIDNEYYWSKLKK